MTQLPNLTVLHHLCDSLFPIGSFAYSDGLESAVSRGLIRDVDALEAWLDVSLEESLGRCDGPAIAIAWSAFEREDWTALAAIDREVTALRPSSAVRTGTRSMGLRLLKTWHVIHPDARLARALGLAGRRVLGPTLPVAFALACSTAPVAAGSAVALPDALSAFTYTRLAGTISAAMRLMSLGQTDAHQLLGRTLGRVPALVDGIIDRGARPESFAPSMDIAQMTQPYVHSRLFRS
jgi:urease accessory protein